MMIDGSPVSSRPYHFDFVRSERFGQPWSQSAWTLRRDDQSGWFDRPRWASCPEGASENQAPADE